MEEEVSYSTVVFKNGAPRSKETDGEAAACSHFRLLLACLGILCVLLVAGIIAIIYISLLMNKQAANLSSLTAENQRLTVEKEISENKTEDLRRERDDLNWTLGVILKFDSFPVKDYCPDKTCQPCLSGWIPFKNKCYLFYNETAPWKTWEESRKYCQNTAADLVIIDSLQEQEFISNYTEYYYDENHGYFIGLHKKEDNWVWIDGRKDTLRYWINGTMGTSGPCGLMIPKKKVTESWAEAVCIFQNKFICEREALLRSN